VLCFHLIRIESVFGELRMQRHIGRFLTLNLLGTVSPCAQYLPFLNPRNLTTLSKHIPLHWTESPRTMGARGRANGSPLGKNGVLLEIPKSHELNGSGKECMSNLLYVQSRLRYMGSLSTKFSLRLSKTLPACQCSSESCWKAQLTYVVQR
jgi:hypothetical protein